MKIKNFDFLRLLNYAATPLIDFLTLAAFILLVPLFVKFFEMKHYWNSVIILGGYLLMCAGIFISKRIESNPNIWHPPDQAQSIPSNNKTPTNKTSEQEKPRKNNVGTLSLVVAWPFSVFVMVMMAETSGVFDRGSSIGEKLDHFVIGGVAGGILFIIGFLIVLLLFPLLLLLKPRPKVAYNNAKHFFLRIFSVTAVNSMIVITTSYWEWQLADAEPLDVALSGKIFIFIFAYLVFLMFYSPPRLALISLEPSRWSFITFMLFLGYTVWRFMS